jgi:hypothetical protein
MKTPREILFQKHHDANAKLDQLRREVFSHDLEQRTEMLSPGTTSISFLAKLWLELIWPSRRIWAGLAAVWMVIAVLNFTSTDHDSPRLAKSETPPMTPAAIAALHEQQRLFVELISSPADAMERPRFVPRPRSERREIIVNA